MMKHKINYRTHSLTGTLLLAAACSTTVALAAETTPAESKPATAPTVIVIENFEGEKNIFGFERDTTNLKEGAVAGRWDVAKTNAASKGGPFPGDWTGKALTFWVHSTAGDNSSVLFYINSQNPATEGSDFYVSMLKVDWQGWKQFRLSEQDITDAKSPHRLRINREPLGWKNISSISMGRRVNPQAKEAAVLTFDALQLESVAPPA